MLAKYESVDDDATDLLLVAIGAPCDEYRDQAREHPGRRAHEQSRHVAKAEGLGKGGLRDCVSQEAAEYGKRPDSRSMR